MLENSNVRKDGFWTSVGIVEIAKLEAEVVTEDSKKFDGDGLEMKHHEETTEREVHCAIDLIGGKDGGVSKSSQSKFDEEVTTLIREVHMINDSDCQETQLKKTNPNLKPLPRIRKTIGGELITSPTTKEGSPVTTVAGIQERGVHIASEIMLCSAVKLFRNGKKDTTVGELNKSYSDICKAALIPSIGIQESSNMCRVLSDQGLLKIGQSRDDRLKRVTLKVDEADITFALQVEFGSFVTVFNNGRRHKP
ncbi:hypothetical protein GIB67_027410 [Kingdonia uniflora]|uniref:Cdc6 C-terminal domain-containing protein n=1 Tax=Kingdonia uniflora TaxID=39325 RepID=A0A7J7MF56_9MAGN|nr:hypothetical protein GIB67_027410 [Kingdonia uniflora]